MHEQTTQKEIKIQTDNSVCNSECMMHKYKRTVRNAKSKQKLGLQETNKRVRSLRGRLLWGRPCSIFTMGISFSVRVKAHVPKTIRKKK